MQGRSFVTALRGGEKPADWRTFTYYRYWMHMAHDLAVPAHFGLRSAGHKLVFFAVSRMSGWTAHILEQYANNRLIRPRADYTGPEYPQRFVPLEQR